MKKTARRLTLSRETLCRLEEAPLLRWAGGAPRAVAVTGNAGCDSPLCGPTYWETCETQIG